MRTLFICFLSLCIAIPHTYAHTRTRTYAHTCTYCKADVQSLLDLYRSRSMRWQHWPVTPNAHQRTCSGLRHHCCTPHHTDSASHPEPAVASADHVTSADVRSKLTAFCAREGQSMMFVAAFGLLQICAFLFGAQLVLLAADVKTMQCLFYLRGSWDLGQ